jgi:hypothetical protein
MTYPAGYGATGLILHEEPNANLLEVLLFESLERHCCSSPTGWNLVKIFRIQITETQLISAIMSARLKKWTLSRNLVS